MEIVDQQIRENRRIDPKYLDLCELPSKVEADHASNYLANHKAVLAVYTECYLKLYNVVEEIKRMEERDANN